MNGYLQYLFQDYSSPKKIYIIRSNNRYSNQIVIDEFQWAFPHAAVELFDCIGDFNADINDMIVFPYAGWNGKILMHEKGKIKPLFESKQNKGSIIVFFETTSRIIHTVKYNKIRSFLIRWYFYTLLIVAIQKFTFLKKLAFISYRLFYK